jgi:hypothetical protein
VFPAHVALQQQHGVRSAYADLARFPLSYSPGLLRLVRGLSTLPGEGSISRLLPVLRRHLTGMRKAIPRFVTLVRSFKGYLTSTETAHTDVPSSHHRAQVEAFGRWQAVRPGRLW